MRLWEGVVLMPLVWIPTNTRCCLLYAGSTFSNRTGGDAWVADIAYRMHSIAQPQYCGR